VGGSRIVGGNRGLEGETEMRVLNSRPKTQNIFELVWSRPLTDEDWQNIPGIVVTLKNWAAGNDGDIIVLPKGFSLQYLMGVPVPIDSTWSDGRLIYKRESATTP